MFEHKKSNPIGCYSEEDKVLPWDLLRSAVMFPTRRDILQSNTFTSELAVQAAVIFREEFRDKDKATSKYLSEIGGMKSLAKLSPEE